MFLNSDIDQLYLTKLGDYSKLKTHKNAQTLWLELKALDPVSVYMEPLCSWSMTT